MVSYVGVPAMIATLGTQYICYGLAKLLTQAVPIANMPDSISFLGRGYIFGGVFPVCVLLMIIVYAIAQFVTSKTRVGRNLYAVGGSREAAFFSGINVKAYQFARSCWQRSGYVRRPRPDVPTQLCRRHQRTEL